MLFANTGNAGPGFKVFRPLILTASGQWRTLSNDELIDQPDFTPFSLEQDYLAPDDFYAKLTKLINPDGLDPKQTYEATLTALVEQIETRVNSVNNGEAYFRKNRVASSRCPAARRFFRPSAPGRITPLPPAICASLSRSMC